MPRFPNPVPQYLDKNGDPIPGGSLELFIAGTSTKAVTFENVQETIANPNPVPLDGTGRIPNIFFTGSLRGICRDKDGNVIWIRDFIGTDIGIVPLSEWNVQISYDLGDYVVGTDGQIYKSLSNGNLGNDPTTDPVNWEQQRFIIVWNPNVDYLVGVIVQTTDGNLWKSLVTPNLNNDPSVDDGTNWIDAVNDTYINTNSNLTATTKQDAIDEIMTIRQSQIDTPLLWLPLTRDFGGIGAGNVDFTRNSVATYVDRYGIVRDAIVDEPRFEKEGLLIEGESTNDCLQSEDFSTTWAVGGDGTIVTNTAISPDGTMTADTFSSVDGGLANRVSQVIPITDNGQRFASSCFVKQDVGPQISLRLTFIGGTTIDVRADFNFSTKTFGFSEPVNSIGVFEELSNGWFRLIFSYPSDGTNATCTYRFGFNFVPNSSVFLWGAQFEDLPFASSYQRTTTVAVLREQDIVSLLIDDNLLDVTHGDHSQFMIYDLLGDVGSNQQLYGALTTPTTTNRCALISQTAPSSILYRDTSTQSATITFSGFGISRSIACITSGNVISVFLDGVKGSDATVTSTDPLNLSGDIHLGAKSDTGSPMYGHLRDIKFFGFALSNVEIQRLSEGP